MRAVWDGARFIRRRRDAWLLSLVPLGIALGLGATLVVLAFASFGPWLGEWLLPDADTWYERGARTTLRWLGSALSAYLGLWLAFLSAPTSSAPALERLVRMQEAELQVPQRPPSNFWRELGCGLEACLGALAFGVPVSLLLWGLGLAVPALLPLLLPLKLLVLAATVAWNLLDYPLTLRGIAASRRVRVFMRNLPPLLGFGLVFVALSVVPGAALLFLPAGVVGATRLAWRILPEAAAAPTIDPSAGTPTAGEN